jgi:hypothetical protein
MLWYKNCPVLLSTGLIAKYSEMAAENTEHNAWAVKTTKP